MSNCSDRGCQTDEDLGSVAEAIISQPVSEDEESTDEEFLDASENVEDQACSSKCVRNLNKEFSSVDPATEETEHVQSSQSDENVSTEKCHEVLEYFSKEVHSSSSETKSVGSSTESAYVIEYRANDEGFTDFVDVSFVDAIKEKDVASLMQKCRVDHYSADSSKVDMIYSKCKLLFERDYVCEVIDNSGGSLCKHYPERIIVPVAKKSNSAGSERIEAAEFDKEFYSGLVKASISCRLRKRFVVPVILYNEKFICRAGTITVRKTAIYETVNVSPPPRSQNLEDSPIKRKARNLVRAFVEVTSQGCQAATQLFVPSAIRKLRNVDAQIIRILNIQYICDLMTEKRKKFTYIRISSSEKINTDIYDDCSIEQMPYPGCRFFKRYHEANHIPEGLVNNWNRPDINMELKLTEDPKLTFPDIEWGDYKTWDVVDLTKNYLKILLTYLTKGRGGLLVHCVSGWDRTPLFISILRVSLWADGIIHESLNYQEMAFLTLAYDWYLFGHDLPTRLGKKQEIMHFCFKFLSYIATDEFSLTRMYNELSPELKENDSFPEFRPGCRTILKDFSSYVLKVYEEFVTGMLE